MSNLTGSNITSDPSATSSGSYRSAHAPLLWIPYVLIALIFIVFLGANFWCYHKKHRERYLRKRDEKRVKEGLHERRRITALMRSHFQSAFMSPHSRDSWEEKGDDGGDSDNGDCLRDSERGDFVTGEDSGDSTPSTEWATEGKRFSWGSVGGSGLPSFVPELPQPLNSQHPPPTYPPCTYPPRPHLNQSFSVTPASYQNAFPPRLFHNFVLVPISGKEGCPGTGIQASRPSRLADKLDLQSPGVASLASPEGTSPEPARCQSPRGFSLPLSTVTHVSSAQSLVSLPDSKALTPNSTVNGSCRTGGGCLNNSSSDCDDDCDNGVVNRSGGAGSVEVFLSPSRQ